MRLIIAEVKTCEKCPYFREDWNHPQDSDYTCECPDRKNDKETFCQFDIFCSQGMKPRFLPFVLFLRLIRRIIVQIEVAKILAEVCDGEVRDDYSGRNMYGKQTAGIVVEGGTNAILLGVLENIDQVQEQLDEIDGPLKFSLREDSMGRYDMIVY